MSKLDPSHPDYYKQDLSKIPSHGHYNVDVAEYDRVKSKGFIYRQLKKVQPRYRVLAGTTGLIVLSLGLYQILMPSSKNRPVRTLTPEWLEATKAYSDEQNKKIYQGVTETNK